MKLNPTGYNVLVEMEEVEQTTESGIVISTGSEHAREQAGHDVGTVVAFGSTAFSGFAGVEGDTAAERAKVWGVQVGDKVEFNRYEGKVPRYPEMQNFRIIQDSHIIATLKED